MKVHISIILLLIMHLSVAIAQTDKDEIKDKVIEERLESLNEVALESELDRTYLVERLEYYYQHPILLNEHCKKNLEELNLLTELQIRDIIEHIKAFGQLSAVEELQQVSTLDNNDILRIMPFVTCTEDLTTVNNTIDSKSHHFIRWRNQRILQKSKGYTGIEKTFKGSPYSINFRYQFNWNKNIEFGLNLEKDAGEQFRRLSSQTFDFQSAYLELRSSKHIPKVIIGDYKASFGQGLTYSSIVGMGKSSEVLLIQRTSHGFSPYKSINEFNYLRGIALAIDLKKLMIQPFFSSKLLDANIILTDRGEYISSFYSNGLHRSENELSKKNKVRSSLAGLNISYNLPGFEFGIISVHRQISHAFGESSAFYKKPVQNKSDMSKAGLYFNLSKLNYSIFSEISQSISSGRAAIFGTVIMPDRNVSLALSVRKYDRDYHIISSGAFGERAENRNENGIYSAIKINVSKSISWSSYVDVFEFPWLNYQVSAPSNGIDYHTEILHRISRKSNLSLRLKWKEKKKDLLPDDSQISNLSDEVKKGLRIQLQFEINKDIRLRSRIEFIEYILGERSEQGMLIFQELKFQRMQSRISFLGRFTVFDTESYQSRIYTYEQDLTGAYSIPSFSGKGSKVIFLIKYRLNRSTKLSFKIGHLVYDDRKSIGSGHDEIFGDSKTEVKWQCTFKF